MRILPVSPGKAGRGAGYMHLFFRLDGLFFHRYTICAFREDEITILSCCFTGSLLGL